MAINKSNDEKLLSLSSSTIESTLSSINVIDVESEEALIRREQSLASETGDVIHWHEKRGRNGAEGLIIAELEEATAQAFDTDLNAFARLQQGGDRSGDGGGGGGGTGGDDDEWEDA